MKCSVAMWLEKWDVKWRDVAKWGLVHGALMAAEFQGRMQVLCAGNCPMPTDFQIRIFLSPMFPQLPTAFMAPEIQV